MADAIDLGENKLSLDSHLYCISFVTILLLYLLFLFTLLFLVLYFIFFLHINYFKKTMVSLKTLVHR